MKKLVFFFVLFLYLFTPAVFAKQPLEFEHKIRKQKTINQSAMIPRVTLAIARINDLSVPSGSSFDEQGKQHLSVEIDGEKKISVYKRQTIEPGFARKTREVMSYFLSREPAIQLIERENINSILREWEFSESSYVKKTDRLQQGIKIPDLVATGFLSSNQLCDQDDDIEEAWNIDDGDDNKVFEDYGVSGEEIDRRRALNAKYMPFSSRYSKKKTKSNYYFLMRVYETHTSGVQYIACGEGNTIKRAIKKAVRDFGCNLNQHGGSCY